jgi:DNA-binding transcriptional ArsR family regulator
MYHTLSASEANELELGTPSPGVIEQLAETFKALGDPTRVRLLYLLSQKELCVHDLAQLLEVTQPAVSHHLRLLRMLGLVRARRVGRSSYYTLDDDHVVQLFHCGLDHTMHRHSSKLTEGTQAD